MQTLLIQEGSIIKVKNTSLPLGTFVKIQPQSVDFLNIYNPKAVYVFYIHLFIQIFLV